jgi:ABC-type multidrug transport system fused ATPase/permease subunit
LTADLLTMRGRIHLTAGELDRASKVAGSRMPIGETANKGLFPTVWWSQEKLWGPALSVAYRRIEWLRKDHSALMLLVLTVVGLGILRGLLLSRARRTSVEAGWNIVSSLRRHVHRQRLRLGPGDLEDADGQQVLSLFTREMDRLRDGIVIWLLRMARCPFEIFVLIGLALLIDWLVALQCLIPVAGCWYLVQREHERFEAARKTANARTDSELRLLAESLQKTRIVRGYGMENFEHEQFQLHMDRFTRDAMAVNKRERWSRRTCRLLAALCAGVVLFLVGSRILQSPDALSFTSAMLILTALTCLHPPMRELWHLSEHRADASLAADRIYRYLDRIPEVGQAVGAKFLEPLTKSLEFESVRYSLPNRKNILNGFDLRLPAGKAYALVSLDPLEALAAAYLLPRFVEPHGGRVLYDGEDIAWVTLESLRLETVYVGGTDPFFTGTVRENICCGANTYSSQQVTDAAKQTHAHNFVLKLPQGYETVLGEHGEQLDAGQGFRLGLARAMLRNPALMIVSEPETTLDDDTKTMLDDTYNRICTNRTVLFLPTRLSTVRRCEQVVLIHQGKVSAIGPHAELLKTSPLYRHWDYMHFNHFRDNGK